ncbi:MAG: hypothetical protein ONA90_07475 [candidate division KSB1 bacterium]|nr:hypothetical protein [candidate division KSB1 bacterium]
MTHGLAKQSQKLAKKEIRAAQQRRKDYLERSK